MARAVCQGAKTAKRYAALGAGMEVDAQGYGREPTAMVRGVLSCLFVCLFLTQNLPSNQLASNIPRFHLFDQSDFSEVRPVSTVSTFPLLLTEAPYTLTNHTIPPIFTRRFHFRHPFHSISTPYPSFHTSFTPLFYYTPASLPSHFNHNYNHNHFSLPYYSYSSTKYPTNTHY